MPANVPFHSPQRHSRRKAARPSELLEAALAEFVDKGYAATRVEAVAQRAGVSKGTLFLYYPSKEALFKALVHDKIASHFGEWNAELEAFEGDSAALLRHALQSWWQRIGQTPACALAKLVLSESPRFPELTAHYQTAVAGPSLALLARILERGVKRGELLVPDLPHACYSLLSPMVFLVMWRHAMAPAPGHSPVLDPVRFLDTQTDFLLAGLRSSPSQRPLPNDDRSALGAPPLECSKNALNNAPNAAHRATNGLAKATQDAPRSTQQIPSRRHPHSPTSPSQGPRP